MLEEVERGMYFPVSDIQADKDNHQNARLMSGKYFFVLHIKNYCLLFHSIYSP